MLRILDQYHWFYLVLLKIRFIIICREEADERALFILLKRNIPLLYCNACKYRSTQEIVQNKVQNFISFKIFFLDILMHTKSPRILTIHFSAQLFDIFRYISVPEWSTLLVSLGNDLVINLVMVFQTKQLLCALLHFRSYLLLNLFYESYISPTIINY